MSRIIDGTLFTAPTSVVTVDSSALSGVTVGGSGAMAILGESLSGQPATPLYFTSPASAVDLLGSGALVDAIKRAFAPGPNVVGAPVVYAVRVNPGTQSQLTLLAGGTAALNLTSVDYGAQTQQIRLQIAAGQNGIGKALTVNYGAFTNTGAQVYRNAVNILFTDNAGSPVNSAVTIGIAGTTLTATLTATGGGTTTRTLDLTIYKTLAAVVAAINNWGTGWAASVTAQSGNDPSTYLDEITATSVYTTSGSAAPIAFYANAKAVLDWFNQSSGFLTATAGTVRKAPDNTTGWLYLGSDSAPHKGNDYGFDGGGGVKTATATADWSAAMNAMLATDVSIICVASADATIHAMLEAHVQQASSSQGKMERVMIVGGASGETMSAVEARATALRDPRVMLVWPGGVDNDPSQPGSGQMITVAPFLLAAQLAGMFCGGRVSDALTHRYVSLQGLESNLTNSQIDELINNGICVVQLVPNRGFRVVRSCSTWIADSNYINTELSVRRAADELSKRLRAQADEVLVGRVASSNLNSVAFSLTDSVLRQAQADGIIVGNATAPAYRNIQVSATGDFLQIDFEASIAIPTNFVQMTAHLTPFTGTVTG